MDNLQILRVNSSLKELVTKKLRSVVLDGTFSPGQKLVEKDLCEMFGISRAVLRESIQQLIAEGLIVNIPHKGSEVATISLKQAREIYDVRQALEALTAYEFVKNANDEQVRSLRKILEELKVAYEDNTYENVLDIKNKFYRTLLEGCNNNILLEMHTILNNRINILRQTSLSSRGRLQNTIIEIEAIVTAIENRDADLASRLCSEHVAIAAKIALERLSKAQSKKEEIN